MPSRFFRVALPEIGYVRAIVEGYDGLAVVRAPDPKRGEIEWLIGDGLEAEAETLVHRLESEAGLIEIAAPRRLAGVLGFRAMRNLTLVAALVAAAAAVARAQAPATDFNVAPAESSLTYHLVHKMHKVDGTSKKLEGKARLTADGKAQVMVRAPSQSFDSGNVNRDEHMKEAVEAAKYPWIELKALGEGVTLPTTFPTTQKKTLQGAADLPRRAAGVRAARRGHLEFGDQRARDRHASPSASTPTRSSGRA